jgi:hypothetical protein
MNRQPERRYGLCRGTFRGRGKILAEGIGEFGDPNSQRLCASPLRRVQHIRSRSVEEWIEWTQSDEQVAPPR